MQIRTRTWLANVHLLLAIFGAAFVPLASSACSAQADDWRALDGEWLYVEDRTEGRASEQQQPPMSVRFVLRIEKDAVVMERNKGDERITLDGPWVGTRRTSSIEERWSPPLGGAMLGVSRTVKRDSMAAFEYLRVIERDGGLVYIAQPGGRPPTEFVLTELDNTRAVLENPRHDFPQRIEYETPREGALSASIGFVNGGRPQRFEFTREDK